MADVCIPQAETWVGEQGLRYVVAMQFDGTETRAKMAREAAEAGVLRSSASPSTYAQ